MRAGWLLWGLLAVAPAWADDLAEMNAVSKTWDRYAELSHADKVDSVDLLAASSLAHFGFLRDAALYASTDQLRRIPSADRMTVYVLRASQSDDKLKAMDDRAVARLCMENGWVGVQSAEGEPLLSLSHVTVMGDIAVGEVAPPTERQFQFGPDFVREGQAWKYRFESMIPDTSVMLDEAIKQSGSSTEQVFQMALAQILKTDNAPSLAALDRPLLDDANVRVRLNEQWPQYDLAYERRIAAVAQKAKQGDSFAELVYGTLQLSGSMPRWVRKDETAGLALLEKSSNGGNAKAAEVVVSYLSFNPKELDDARLRRLTPHLLRAANGGSAESMEMLGGFYFAGEGGLAMDCVQAAQWQARAEEAGSKTARNELVWTWATCPLAEQRNPAKAMALAEHMIKQQDSLEASELDTVAAALAAGGRFDEAVKFQQMAVDKTKADAQTERRLSHRLKRMQARLNDYKKGRPFVQNLDVFAEMRAGRY